jgi:hypothetical protein
VINPWNAEPIHGVDIWKQPGICAVPSRDGVFQHDPGTERRLPNLRQLISMGVVDCRASFRAAQQAFKRWQTSLSSLVTVDGTRFVLSYFCVIT